MRITEQRLFEQAGKQIGRARERVADATGPLSTGIEIGRPSDDPARWAAGRRADVRSQVGDLRSSALSAANTRLTEAERVFTSVGDVLSRARELAVLAANGAQGQESRIATSGEVKALIGSALQAVNSRGIDGEFLLGGNRGTSVPFDATGAFVGDGNTRTIEAGEGTLLEVSVTGSLLTAASGVDIFAELNSFLSALETNDLGGIQNAIGTLEAGIHQVSQARAKVGGLQNSVEAADQAREQFELVLREVHLRAVEADPIQAASELAQSSQALEAAQAVTQRIAQLIQVV